MLIINIAFYEPDSDGISREEAREVLLSAFDIVGDNENAGIFRDRYGVVSNDTIGEIVMEVSNDNETGGSFTADDHKNVRCYIWQDGKWLDI